MSEKNLYYTPIRTPYDTPNNFRLDFTVAGSIEEAQNKFEKKYKGNLNFFYDPERIIPVSLTGIIDGYRISLKKKSTTKKAKEKIYYSRIITIWNKFGIYNLDFTVAESRDNAIGNFKIKYRNKYGFSFDLEKIIPVSETGIIDGYKISLEKIVNKCVSR